MSELDAVEASHAVDACRDGTTASRQLNLENDNASKTATRTGSLPLRLPPLWSLRARFRSLDCHCGELGLITGVRGHGYGFGGVYINTGVSDCYQQQWFQTRHGLRLRTVNVCADNPY